jgi:hypothetical protein
VVVTDAQRARALERANRIRYARADWKVDMRRSRHPDMIAADLVRDPEWWAVSWELRSLLLSVPGLGSARVQRQLQRFGIDAEVRLEGLSRRQREVVAAWLVMRAVDKAEDALAT